MTSKQELLHREARPSCRHQLSVGLARSEREIEEAKRLRYRVFAGEMGARLPTRQPGIDHDIYDPFCDHLVVRDEGTAEVVGTYRILVATERARIGSYYSENRFDLTRLQHLRPRLVEIDHHASIRITAAAPPSPCSGLASLAT